MPYVDSHPQKLANTTEHGEGEGEGDLSLGADGFEEPGNAQAGAIIEAQEEFDRLAGAKSATSGGAKGGTAALVPRPPRVDKNVLLTQSDDWGQNKLGKEFDPPVLPHRPNSRQRVLTQKLMGGEKVKNPRDRDPEGSRKHGAFSRAKKVEQVLPVVPSTLLLHPGAGSRKQLQ